MNLRDVPSPIDLRNARDAREWERTAQARPGRTEIFQAFVRSLLALGKTDMTVLELGSGPGFLAAEVLDALPVLHLTLLDFSPAMHDLARARLGPRAAQVHFVERSFKTPGWSRDLGRFDAVITNQSVHELRHKRHAPKLYAEVREILRPKGVFLVSDHFAGEGGLANNQLYMAVDEQQNTLLGAGFSAVVHVVTAGSLAMHCATCPL
jgi:SAM-dependent methyltransferase